MVIMAMAGAFWAYDGWINVTYMSGEIKNVQRTLPLFKNLAGAGLLLTASRSAWGQDQTAPADSRAGSATEKSRV